MAKEKYKSINFRLERLEVIEKCNEVLEDFEAQGYDVTLRQLYYQMIANDYFPETWIDPVYNAKHGLQPDTKNTEKNYERLGSLVNDARLAGLIDWNYIVDRTRSLKDLSHWKNPAQIIDATTHNFRLDKWKTQEYRPEIWVEKDALVGVLGRIANELDVPIFSCRGYTSASEMHVAGKRLDFWRKAKNQTPIIFHFGDHDPSGLDMSRDICDRLEMFCGEEMDFERLALNMPQIRQYNPPPNPAKLTDSRSNQYVKNFGLDSWELDALKPDALAALVRDAIETIIDRGEWQKLVDQENDERETLEKISSNYARVKEYVENLDDE